MRGFGSSGTESSIQGSRRASTTDFDPHGEVHAPRLEPGLFDGWLVCPMLLRDCVAPRRAEWLQHQPRLSKLASLDPVGLHTCPTARLAGPFERKAKPRSIAFNE